MEVSVLRQNGNDRIRCHVGSCTEHFEVADLIAFVGEVHRAEIIGVADLVVERRAAAVVDRGASHVPVYVLADETKMLPVGFPQILEDDRPAVEVWDAPSGVEVWNRYFEITPMRSISAIVTEGGVLTPAQIQQQRDELTLPAGLRAWAMGRT